MSVDYKSLRNRYSKYEENGGVEDDFGGSNRRNILDLSGYNSVSFWKPEAGVHGIDIIPYIVQSNKHPSLKKGEPDYVIDVWAHRRVGPNKDNILCPKKMGWGPCPICEQYEEEFEEKLAEKKEQIRDDKKAWKSVKEDLNYLAPKRRVLYNIIDTAEPDKGIQLFEAPWFWFEKELAKLFLVKQQRKPNTPYFWQHDDGLTVEVNSTNDSYNGVDFVKSEPVGFEERDKQYKDDIVEQAYPLDALMEVLSYDEIKNSMLGIIEQDDEDEDGGSEEEEPETEPKTEPKKLSKEERMKKLQAKKKSAPTCPVEGGTFGEDYCAFDECEDCPHVEECGKASGMED